MLDIVWAAEFVDKTILYQYEEAKENLFKDVLDNQDKLNRFILFNRVTGDCYIADLTNGCLSHTRQGEPFLLPREDMLRKEETKYRLIYFREVERTFNTDLQEVGQPSILYFLGVQFTDSNGFNHKKLMRIHKDGRWILS